VKNKRFLIVAALVLGLALGSVGIAYAITYGEPDGNGHPYVGFVTFYDASGTYMWRCSGTLVSPTVLLTAGHCTFGTTSAKVWFDADLNDLERPYPDCGGHTCYTGTPHPHPGYDDFATFPNTSDVGVVVLDTPVEMGTYGELPELGVLDDLATRRGHQDLIIRSVGYGLQCVKPVNQADKVRYTSTSMIVNVGSHVTDGYNLHTSNNPGNGHGTSGGSCSGDSGGPLFYPEDSNVVVAVVSFGMNANCKGADFSYRVDIANSQDFIEEYLRE